MARAPPKPPKGTPVPIKPGITPTTSRGTPPPKPPATITQSAPGSDAGAVPLENTPRSNNLTTNDVPGVNDAVHGVVDLQTPDVPGNIIAPNDTVVNLQSPVRAVNLFGDDSNVLTTVLVTTTKGLKQNDKETEKTNEKELVKKKKKEKQLIKKKKKMKKLLQ